jgi:hypothetical protein
VDEDEMTIAMTPPRSTQFLPGFPAFVNELVGTLAVHAQYVLHGNIRDRYLVTLDGDVKRPMRMLQLLWEALRRSGCECLICYDPVDGVTVFPPVPLDRARHVRPASRVPPSAGAVRQ